MSLNFAILLIAFTFIWVIPLIFILSDPSISGKEKAIWTFAVIFVSWFAWILYFFVAPVLPKPKTYDFDSQA